MTTAQKPDAIILWKAIGTRGEVFKRIQGNNFPLSSRKLIALTPESLEQIVRYARIDGYNGNLSAKAEDSYIKALWKRLGL